MVPVGLENQSRIHPCVSSSISSKVPTQRTCGRVVVHLKSLVGCYHWFHVQEEGGSTFRCPWRWKTILLAPSCNYKPTMGLVTETNNPYEYDVKVKDQNMEGNLHIQPPPTLWSIGHQSSLIIRKYKHHPFAAHTRISSVITPTSPPQYPISN